MNLLRNRDKKKYFVFINKIINFLNNLPKPKRVLFYFILIILLTLAFVFRQFYVEATTNLSTSILIVSLLKDTCSLFKIEIGEKCGWSVFSFWLISGLLAYLLIFIFLTRFKIKDKVKLFTFYGATGFILGILRIVLSIKSINDFRDYGLTPNVIVIILIFPLGYVLCAILFGILVELLKVKRYAYAILILFLFLILASYVLPYKVEPNMTVHQHITKEASKVWKLIPFEVKNHTRSSIQAQLDDDGYQGGEDAVVGSGEEDEGPELFPFKNHFWNPDNPNTLSNGSYNDGLDVFGVNVDSSYKKAKELWTERVIKNYLKGNINESYYWLGRVVHLLEDAAQPSHVLIDCHMDRPVGRFICSGSQGDNGSDDSVLEEYTGNNFTILQNTFNWSGENFAGQQYDYDNLQNMANFNWREVEPTRPLDKQNIELFRLFWYVAQKTQYFASDDVDGNTVYVNISGSQKDFSTSLWAGDGVTIINRSSDLADDDITDDGEDIKTITNAVIPHSMKAVAGLYRLFWDAVHIDWPTYHHDNRRTGFTLLKGDIPSSESIDPKNLVLEKDLATDHFARPSIGDIDNDGTMDIVISASFNSSTGHVYAAEHEVPFESVNKKLKEIFGFDLFKTKLEQRWDLNIGEPVRGTPSIGNIDSDSTKEVVFGLVSGKVKALDINGGTASEKWSYSVPAKESGIGTFAGETRYTAIDDIDLDGTNEVIFTDYLQGSPEKWPGDVYVLNGATGALKYNYTTTNNSAEGAVSLANVDSDDYMEIIVPSYYGVYVFDYDQSANKLKQKWNNSDGRVYGAAVVYDIDRDNEYEIIYTTTNLNCAAGKSCYNRIKIVNASNGHEEKNISLSIYSIVTPSIANLDSDSNLEIVVVGKTSSSMITNDRVEAYDSSSSNQDWQYTASNNIVNSAPNIADLDGDGNYNVLLSKNDTELLILKNDGTLNFTYNAGGLVGSSPIVGDLDDDGTAEIATKRVGASDSAIFSILSGSNKPPRLNYVINNITGLTGGLIDINESGKITGTDPDGDQLTFSYSSPFNLSGLWQTNVNDTGNYTVLVEVSDGRLSSYQYVDIMVFDSSKTSATTNFADGSSKKSFAFTQLENKTIQVRLPKQSTVAYSKLGLRGSTS